MEDIHKDQSVNTINSIGYVTHFANTRYNQNMFKSPYINNLNKQASKICHIQNGILNSTKKFVSKQSGKVDELAMSWT